MSGPLASKLEPASTATALGSSLLALVFVITLILAMAWLLRRLPGVGARSHNALKIVATLPVGVKERVMVIAAGDQQLLIGVTSEQITLLQRLEHPLPEPGPAPEFATVLQRLRGKPTP